MNPDILEDNSTEKALIEFAENVKEIGDNIMPKEKTELEKGIEQGRIQVLRELLEFVQAKLNKELGI